MLGQLQPISQSSNAIIGRQRLKVFVQGEVDQIKTMAER